MAKTLEELKAEADLMGIEYPEKVNYKKLEKLIKDAGSEREEMINSKKEKEEEKEVDISILKPGIDTTGLKIHPTEAELNKGKEKDPLKEAKRLVWVMVNNMDINTGHESQVHVSIANAKWGTIADRVIPFGVKWAVEKCIVDYLMSKTYTLKQERKIQGEHSKAEDTVIEKKTLPKYAVQILPQPTRKEIEQLAKDQRQTQRLEND
jgi:hypothetical protein